MSIRFPDSTSSSPNVEKNQKLVRSIKSNSTEVAGNSSVAQETPSAEVSLSNTGIQALKAQLTNLPDIRQERVQGLQMAIGNETYNPSSQQIAEAIHADLFGGSSSTQP